MSNKRRRGYSFDRSARYAFASGRRSSAKTRYFNGEKLQWHFKSVRPKRLEDTIVVPDEEAERLKREKMPCLNAAKRTGNFDEVETGLTEQMCVDESKRCLRCDL